jgi:hypothetical protein
MLGSVLKVLAVLQSNYGPHPSAETEIIKIQHRHGGMVMPRISRLFIT